MKRFLALSILALAISTGISYVAVSQNVIPQTVERSGCCSHHGGVAYCGKNGYYICRDGSQSPSCRCK